MLICSIDLETTGLNPDAHQILQIGAVILDTSDLSTPVKSRQSFNCYVSHPVIVGSAFALTMNQKILAALADAERGDFARTSNTPVFAQNRAIEAFEAWLADQVGVSKNGFNCTFAGKNVASFDLPFLKAAGFRGGANHRAIDPTIAFVDWATDITPPGLEACLKRAGLQKTVAHDALEDARDVAELILHIIKSRQQ